MSNNDKILNALARLAVAEDSTEAARAKAEIKGLMKGGETDAPPRDEKGCDVLTMLKIRKLLTELGMPGHIKGYAQTAEAIRLCVEDDKYLYAVTKKLYPEVGKNCGGDDGKLVERNIRHGLELVWSRCSLDTLDKYFGNSISPARGRATNSEFLARTSEIIRLQLEGNA